MPSVQMQYVYPFYIVFKGLIQVVTAFKHFSPVHVTLYSSTTVCSSIRLMVSISLFVTFVSHFLRCFYKHSSIHLLLQRARVSLLFLHCNKLSQKFTMPAIKLFIWQFLYNRNLRLKVFHEFIVKMSAGTMVI
jgi:hypothetical protein